MVNAAFFHNPHFTAHHSVGLLVKAIPFLAAELLGVGQDEREESVLREKCPSDRRVRSAVLIFFDDRPPDARKVIKVTAAVALGQGRARFPDLLLV